MKRSKKIEPISKQVRGKVISSKTKTKKPTYTGDTGKMISTGSTLLDLAISGGRIRGGGIPSGILVEIFGPSGTGKTVLLSEVAGNIQNLNGEVMFHDPEARLNKQFALLFGFELDNAEYSNPNTVPELFRAVRGWEPKNSKMINGVFADSLAALSTDMEMDEEDGDKMGMRRAKEFSQELRRTCRILVEKNLLMVCSNQIRQNLDAGPYGSRYKSPGGEAVGFYSSLRLRTQFALRNAKLRKTVRVASKEVKRVIGVNIEVEVFKSSVWKPQRTAPVTIIFDYGIDDIRQNLQFIKNYKKYTIYTVGNTELDKSMDESIRIVEDGDFEEQLQAEVIDLWEEIEGMFNSERKTKKR